MGGGIGRVTKYVLDLYFDEIDLLDYSDVQIEQAKRNVPFVARFYNCGLQDFVFEKNRSYDCIWVQGVALYLKDADLLRVLKECASSLEESNKQSMIVIKENYFDVGEEGDSGGSQFVIDGTDHSLIRNIEHF